jgi:4'-phosphopantetheinyl transferase
VSARHKPWSDGPDSPALADGEVHVWLARLRQPESAQRELWLSLSADERARAGRFHFRDDMEHFVVARGTLRHLLARYTGVAPHQIRFSYNGYGKPAMDGETGSPLRFNASHSNALALYAVARGREVGIDIEFVREDFAGFEIAERFFSPREVSALRALPEGERVDAFFDCWVRKEAYIKARGEGLSHPLHTFTVSLTPGEPAALLHTEGDSCEAARWSLVGLYPCEGYRAALALEGGPPSLSCWRWP